MTNEIRTSSTYKRIGGAKILKNIVDDFYMYMDILPEAKTIRAQHAEDLSETREKLFMFLSGWMGGPDLYIEAFGHPRLRSKHVHFPIGEKERDEWLFCMSKALSKAKIDSILYEQLMSSFTHTANHMMNK